MLSKHARSEHIIFEPIENESFDSEFSLYKYLGIGIREQIGPIPQVVEDFTHDKKFNYGRLFDRRSFLHNEGFLEKLSRLAEVMHAGRDDDSNMPVGYTYLGQLIAHEVTRFRESSVDNYYSLNNPKIDLDSIFSDKTDVSNRRDANGYYEIGSTNRFGSISEHTQDLYRPNNPVHGTAEISDPRNDVVLPLAQLHLLMLRFYNKVVGFHFEKYGRKGSHEEILNLVVQHFQSIVLYDYLPKIVPATIIEKIEQNGPQIKTLSQLRRGMTEYQLPIEFAAAIFRFGHSMIKRRYKNWNRLHDAGIGEFLKNTFAGRYPYSYSKFQLSSQWLTDWSRLFYLKDKFYDWNDEVINEPIFANKIDTDISLENFNLPENIFEDENENLSTVLSRRTLERSVYLELASAQDAIDHLKCEFGIEIPKLLKPDFELATLTMPKQFEILCENDEELINCTPLWFYILAEAKRENDGNKLGSLGGLITAETLYRAVKNSSVNIFEGDSWCSTWKPTLPSKNGNNFTMSDLIYFVKEPNILR